MSNYENNIGGKARSYMRGPRGKAFTYEDFTPEQLEALKGKVGKDGVNGKDGVDGFSPTIAVADISGGHRVTITDAKGTKSFDVMDGKDGEGGSGSGGSGAAVLYTAQQLTDSQRQQARQNIGAVSTADFNAALGEVNAALAEMDEVIG